MRNLIVVLLFGACAARAQPPERMLADPASLAAPMDLTLAPGRTSTIQRAVEGVSGFNLHSYLAFHDGRFWAIWSSAKVNEEDPDQLVRYSTSSDGHTWAPSQILVDDPDGPAGPQRWIARGIWVDNGRLTALAALVESAEYGKRGEATVWRNLRLMRFFWSKGKWVPAGVYAENCMNNFPPVRLGKLFAMPCRDAEMNLSMALADSPGPANWRLTPIVSAPPFHRMDEPTIYTTSGGVVHMIIRDGNRSGFLIRALSHDHGRTWSAPVLTDYPDATSKNFAGRLSSGEHYLINNPHPKQRDPLVISFSRDGWIFSRPVALRRNAPPRHIPPLKRGSIGFQYPHAIERRGSLWVIYSTNKEDIEISEFKLSALIP